MSSSECLFCRIINKTESAYIVYDDPNNIAFLDRYPIVPGHTLVVTKEHYRDFLRAPPESIAQLSNATRKVATAVKLAMEADGVRIFTNVGKSAGQVIFHVHVHILPSWDNEPVFLNFKKRNEIDANEAVEISRSIKEAFELL